MDGLFDVVAFVVLVVALAVVPTVGLIWATLSGWSVSEDDDG